MNGSAKSILTRERLQDLAFHCYSFMNITASRESALHMAAEYLSNYIGEYFGPDILVEPDELSINFIELLDQIVFEISQKKGRDESINEYILEDLYSRLRVFIDIFQGENVYKSNLPKRKLFHEDTVIIRHFHMEEFVQKLASDFDDHPDLQKDIIRTLIPFRAESLLSFYYKVFMEEITLDLKLLSLAGLASLGKIFGNWNQLKKEFPSLKDAIDFAHSFDRENVWKNPVPSGLNSCIILSVFAETGLKRIMDEGHISWLFRLYDRILEFGESENIFYGDVCKGAANMILMLGPGHMKNIMMHNATLASFITIVDMLPLDQFNRIKTKISGIFNGHTPDIKKLFSSGAISVNPDSSNTMNYIFIDSANIF